MRSRCRPFAPFSCEDGVAGWRRLRSAKPGSTARTRPELRMLRAQPLTCRASCSAVSAEEVRLLLVVIRLRRHGFQLKQVILPEEPIKQTGSYEVTIQLVAGVEVPVKLEVKTAA